VLADAACGREHVLEIDRTLLVGRRASADERQRPVVTATTTSVVSGSRPSAALRFTIGA
jgi:hypothetical protein